MERGHVSEITGEASTEGMDVEELKELSDHDEHPSVSIFLPTRETLPDRGKNPIRLKNRIQEAKRLLVSRDGIRPPMATEVLAPIERLLDDEAFWRRSRKGLALFASRAGLRIHWMPYAPAELTVVSNRFHLKPLIPALTSGLRFFLLAVSKNEVRLFRGQGGELHRIETPELSGGLSGTLRHDDKGRRELQFHTGTAPGRQARAAVFFGHGVAGDDAAHKKDLDRYLRHVDRAVGEVLQKENAPLILAGVEYVITAFRDVCSYPHLWPGMLTGNLDEAGPEELRDEATPLLEPLAREEVARFTERYLALEERGLSSHDLPSVVRAAHEGRVDTALVPLGVQEWGSFDEKTRSVKLHREPQRGDRDLLDLVAIETLSHGGTVWAVAPEEIPNGHRVAAVLRY